jgi:hypothetical protein
VSCYRRKRYVCSQKVSLLIYLSFSPVPKEGPTVALFPPTPLPEPQNSSFLHRLNNCDTISAYTPKMAFTARSKTTRSTPTLTFETLILVDFSRGAGQLLPLQDRQQALVDTNVLLLGLDHPNALFTHRVDYAENVDVVGYEDLLQDAIQADEGTGATHAGAATRISRRLYNETPTHLQWTTMGRWSGATRSLKARTNRTRVWGGLGTPKSGHVVKWK